MVMLWVRQCKACAAIDRRAVLNEQGWHGSPGQECWTCHQCGCPDYAVSEVQEDKGAFNLTSTGQQVAVGMEEGRLYRVTFKSGEDEQEALLLFSHTEGERSHWKDLDTDVPFILPEEAVLEVRPA